MINKHKEEFEQVIAHLIGELVSIRTSRASPILVENIEIETYGSKMRLIELASIALQDTRTLIIEPWDKSITKDIEKGIRESNLGLSPVLDGIILRIVVPTLTEERRKELLKLLSEKLEDSRVKIRRIRDEIREEIQKAEKSKEIGEDEKFRLFKNLDEKTREYIEKIDDAGARKKEEIFT